MCPSLNSESDMQKRYDIIEDHMLKRKLVGVWEIVNDDHGTMVEGVALSLEGYFLEIEAMLDVSAIEIGCGHSSSDFPIEDRPCCFYNEVSHDLPYSEFIGKRLLKWRLLVGQRGPWEGLILSFGPSSGLCFINVDGSISVLTLNGVQC